jgi:hypothetical protein
MSISVESDVERNPPLLGDGKKLSEAPSKPAGPPPKPPLEDFSVFVPPSVLPDPEAPLACDIFYHVGNVVCKVTPGVIRDAITEKAPPEVSGVKGGVERTCGLLVLLHILTAMSYLYFLLEGYAASSAVQYLSLSTKGGVCEPVLMAISDVYSLDDSGYWVRCSNE